MINTSDDETAGIKEEEYEDEDETKNCEFCAIARGENRFTEVICESDDWVAFFPLNPATPGHTLVIPRFHVTDLWAMESHLGAKLMTALIEVGRAIHYSLAPEGMNLITSAGSVAEQSVFHLHFHILPRWQTDGFGRIWPPVKETDDIDLEDIAGHIRTAYIGLESG
jgi:histidine triad (HIT) family protein